MSTSFSSLKHFEELAQSILREFSTISQTFSEFQKDHKLDCVSGCGKCCFKSDVYCSPIELLPLAMELLRRGDAQEVYDRCDTVSAGRCFFLVVDNAEKYLGKCSEYLHRPLVCRAFGVSARHSKNNQVDFSVCQVIKEQRSVEFQEMLSKVQNKELEKLPFIDYGKNQLATLDPRFLEREYPLNESLKMILEKVLLVAQYA